MVAVALAVGLLAGGIGGVTGWALAEREHSQQLTDDDANLETAPAIEVDRAPESVAGIAARVLPSVANIQVRASGGSGTGSGFVIREDGYVLTNNHVVASGEEGRITLSFQDVEDTYEAQIVGTSPEYDLAVLKIDPTGSLPVASLGNDDEVVVGDPVVAIGSPLGLAGTVTSGIISAKNRPVTAGGGGDGEVSYISALQTDAAVNPGNSGGPLVDAAGRVIGINSSIATLGGSSPFGEQAGQGNIGLGFAIPINQGRRIAEELISTGRAAFPIIGASIDFAYDGDGARIADPSTAAGDPLVPGGPAEQAGLQPGDVILSFDGRPVAGPEELIVAIRSRRPGETVDIGYERVGTRSRLRSHSAQPAGDRTSNWDSGQGSPDSRSIRETGRIEMLDVGFGEILILAAAALFIFGPDKLPKLAADAARTFRTLRQMIDERPARPHRSLGPEFDGINLDDLNPRTFVRKQLLDDVDDDLDETDPEQDRTAARRPAPRAADQSSSERLRLHAQQRRSRVDRRRQARAAARRVPSPRRTPALRRRRHLTAYSSAAQHLLVPRVHDTPVEPWHREPLRNA